MKVPFPICFATLRKGVDGHNADDGYDSMGVVLGWQDGSSDNIQNLEHHITALNKASSQTSFVGRDGVSLGWPRFWSAEEGNHEALI